MSLHDRDYSRGSHGSGDGWGGAGRGGGGGGGGAGDALRQVGAFFNWSFSIGRFFGIRVRVHILFLLLVLTRVWPDPALTRFGVSAAEQMIHSLRWIGLLFGSVLLHEFGHCFGCRSVGGRADDILMWPLGGLAYCDPPRRPWPEFVTVACGPLVNVALAGASFLVLLGWLGAARLPISLDPFDMWTDGYWHYEQTIVTRLLADLFVVNYALLLFNVLLIFYPFDGGRLVQIALWKWLGYIRSMRIATSIGMGGAVVVAGVGLWQGSFLLVLIAIFGFITCMQQRQHLRYATTDEPETDPRFAAAYETQSGKRGAWFGAAGGEGRGADADRPAKPGAVARWREARQVKQAAAARRRVAEDEAEMNRILDKVRDAGLQSLTQRERNTLQRATDRQRGG